MFDEAERLDNNPYFRTKHESERLVREECQRPWRVYRPGIVVGDSRTGEIDKIDGPYFIFKSLQRLRRVLPSWLPTRRDRRRRDQHRPGRLRRRGDRPHRPQAAADGRAFHLTDPEPAHGGRGDQPLRPRGRRAADGGAARHRRHRAGDGRGADGAEAVPAGKARRQGWRSTSSACRPRFSTTSTIPTTFDSTKTQKALKGSGIEVPPLESYATRVWDYWERNLDPDLFKDRSLSAAVRGKVVLITGASSGIGKATAVKVADAGATVLLVARSLDKLEETKEEIVAGGGTAHIHQCDLVRHRRHRADGRGGARLPRPRRHPRQQRRPLDPPLDRPLLRPLPRLRADDPAQLPRRGAADPGAAAGDARPQVAATSSTSARSGRRPTRRASPPTSPRRRRSTRSAG